MVFAHNRLFFSLKKEKGASQVVLVVKNLLASAGEVRDAGLNAGSGRSLGGGHGNHSSILAWRICGQRSLSDMTEAT